MTTLGHPLNERTERDSTRRSDARVRRRSVAWLAAAVVVVAVVAAATMSPLGGGSAPPAEATAEGGLDAVTGQGGDPLPLHTLPGLSGGPALDLREQAGAPLLVNFWATWCGPCVREMPMLRDVSRELSDDLTFIGVNVQDSPTQAEEFLDDLGVRYRQAADPEGEYFRAVGGVGMPTTLFVDADGIVRYRHTGELTEQKMRALLSEHLAVR